jgi:Na+/melibiose symporter-like transporter
MKCSEAYTAGAMVAFFGVGMLQSVPRRDAWGFVVVGAAIAIIAVVASISSVVRERRRKRDEAQSKATKEAEQ